MTRQEWMERLAEIIRPRSPRPTALALARLLPFVADVPDRAFTDASLRYVAAKLTRTPNLAELRDVLDAYLRSLDRPPADSRETAMQAEQRAWEERQDELRRDWDDPQAILRKVNECRGEPRFLRLLAVLVAKWAPQHLGMIPPAVLEAVAADATIPALVELRRIPPGPAGPLRSIDEQRDAMSSTPPPRYLDPETLDRINPLPNGRKRANAATAPAAPLDPDAAAAVAAHDQDAASAA